jgi:hypothetical protein
VGDRKEPCGTPVCISLAVDISASPETLNFLRKKTVNKLNRLFENFNSDNSHSKPRCHVVTKAFSVSKEQLKFKMQSRAEQSSSLLPATSQHGHSWHRAPLGPMAIYLFNVKTFVFFLLSLFLL